MGARSGVLIGDHVGVKAAPDGSEELQGASRTIATSEGVRDLLSGGPATLRDGARRGGSILAARLADPLGPFARAA